MLLPARLGIGAGPLAYGAVPFHGADVLTEPSSSQFFFFTTNKRELELVLRLGLILMLVLALRTGGAQFTRPCITRQVCRVIRSMRHTTPLSTTY